MRFPLVRLPVLAGVLLVSILTAPATRAAAPLPIETFTKNPTYSAAQISPDGKFLGFVSSVGNKGDQPSLYFSDLATGKMTKIEVPASGALGQNLTVTSFTWVNDQRIIFTTSGYGSFAVNRDGSNWQQLTGPGETYTTSTIFASEVAHVFADRSGKVLMLQRDYIGDHAKYPTVIEVNTLTGKTAGVAENIEEITRWVVDQSGRVRVGVNWNGEKTRVFYRESDDAAWRVLPGFSNAGLGSYPLAFDYDGHTVYTAALTADGTWGLYAYDLTTQKQGALIFSDPTYDIFNPGDLMGGRAGLIFSKKKRALVGLRYTTEVSQTVWFDAEMQQVQATLDQALPGVMNQVIGWSDDENRILVISWSDRQPGVYYLLDRATQELRRIVDRTAWIKPEQLAPTLPLKFRARDGLAIRGYLTAPLGVERKNLPLVVFPHGGPWVRDTLSFEPLVKFLADRGYAVLQVNFRGSPGYGDAFSRAGRRQIGKAIQDDITDGVQWAIRSGTADPKRIAIVGASYGGYSALWALTRTPELYRCGMSLAGVSDWLAIIKGRDGKSDTRDAYRFWRDQIGDPETDETILREISPINHLDHLRAPLFVVQGGLDTIVPPNQASRLIAELERRKLPHQVMLRGDEGHSWFGPKNRIELFKQLEAFLAKHMTPASSPNP